MIVLREGLGDDLVILAEVLDRDAYFWPRKKVVMPKVIVDSEARCRVRRLHTMYLSVVLDISTEEETPEPTE